MVDPDQKLDFKTANKETDDDLRMFFSTVFFLSWCLCHPNKPSFIPFFSGESERHRRFSKPITSWKCGKSSDHTHIGQLFTSAYVLGEAGEFLNRPG